MHTRLYALMLLCLVPGLLLSGCAGLRLQDEAARYPGHFRLQALLGRCFAAAQPLTVLRLRNLQFLSAQHGLPLAVQGPGWGLPDAIYHDELMRLPPGTVLQLVGESSWYAWTVHHGHPANAQAYGYVIVHGLPQAHDLLLPLPAGLFPAAARGAPPVLVESAQACSPWTRARYDAIRQAAWAQGIDLKLQRRVIPP